MAERRRVGDTRVRGWTSAATARDPGQVARFVSWLCLVALATLSLVRRWCRSFRPQRSRLSPYLSS
jgi:hypothetical protein